MSTIRTKEDKQLLLIDLCSRLLYGVKIKFDNIKETVFTISELGYLLGSDHDIIPYLRPMNSMTEKEKSELRQWGCLCMTPDDCVEDIGVYGAIHSIPVIDWLNAHHFDHRRLIEKGLALVAPEGMYVN